MTFVGEQLALGATRDTGLTPLLDRWTAQLLRGGAYRRSVVRSPLDAGRAVVALVAAAGVWWFGGVGEPLGWQLTWQWVLLLLVVVAAFGLIGSAVLVAVLAVHSRRWGPATAAAVAGLAGVALLVAAARGATVWTGAWWALAVRGATAVWPASLAAVRRSLLIGVMAAVLFVLGGTTMSWVDVFALAALGYAGGCVCRHLVGRDVDEVSADEATAYAAELGVEVSHATTVAGSRVGDRFRAHAGVGDVDVTVYGRSAVDGQLLVRALRVLWYRNARLPVPLTRLQHLEHHVALTAHSTSRG